MQASLAMERLGPFPTIGRCIYCLEVLSPEELTKEHIVPRALNGSWIIQKAACVPCIEDFNKKFENVALQGEFLIPRLVLGLRRRKKKAKKMPPLVATGSHLDALTVQHSDRTVQLTPEQFPPHAIFVVWEPPGKMIGIDRSAGFRYFRSVILPELKNPHFRPVPGTKTAAYTPMNAGAFLVTIAKIAYCYAITKFGVDGFDGNEIRELIRGKRDDVFNFAGSPAEVWEATSGEHQPSEQSKYLHTVSHEMIGGLVIVSVRLFASFGAPPYQVVVGKPK